MLKTKHCTIFLALLLLNAHLGICGGSSVFDPNSVESRRFCGGKMRDCGGMGMEGEMESEMSRRVLVMQKRYISYDTLKRDLVPCDTPGDSYYNCKGPAASHPYNRGCEIITRCARGEVSDINS
nr:protein RALF-like 24 [Ipomoea trifida]